jgi:hypothetical protein
MNANRRGLVGRQVNAGLCIRPSHEMPYSYLARNGEHYSASSGGIVIFRVELDYVYVFGGPVICESHILKEDPL